MIGFYYGALMCGTFLVWFGVYLATVGPWVVSPICNWLFRGMSVSDVIDALGTIMPDYAVLLLVGLIFLWMPIFICILLCRWSARWLRLDRWAELMAGHRRPPVGGEGARRKVEQASCPIPKPREPRRSRGLLLTCQAWRLHSEHDAEEE